MFLGLISFAYAFSHRSVSPPIDVQLFVALFRIFSKLLVF